MLVDDSEADLLFTRIVLERASREIEVLPFEEGGAALAHLRTAAAHGIELILLDINMPGMNGFEFLDAYAALPAACRDATEVVMLSSSSDPADRERALACPGVVGYLTKPIDLAALAALERRAPA
ncbi:response regulator [Rubrivivax gelatinosus]|nr:response regulator [Rubrivivax gelatinosus]